MYDKVLLKRTHGLQIKRQFNTHSIFQVTVTLPKDYLLTLPKDYLPQVHCYCLISLFIPCNSDNNCQIWLFILSTLTLFNLTFFYVNTYDIFIFHTLFNVTLTVKSHSLLNVTLLLRVTLTLSNLTLCSK